jgi:hypothetical protein
VAPAAELAFVLITPLTAVQQILQRMSTPFGAGPKMIDSQCATGIGFCDPTILTGELSPLAHCLADVERNAHVGSDVAVRGNWR